jgi:hypothetical protein
MEGNVRMNLREKGWEVVDWIHLAKGGKVWIGFIWLRIGTCGGLL